MNKHVEIVNKDGRVLRGYINIPENFTGELIVMFHGYTGHKTEHNGHFRTLTRKLDPKGIGTMRLDFSGNGESDGEFLDFTFDTLVSDASIMVEYALNLEGVEKVSLLGFSMGGAVAGMMASKYLDKIHRVVLWSPAANILSLIRNRYENAEKDENENAIISCWSLSKAMYESLDKYDVMKGIENYKGQVFIVQGNKDLSVPYMNAVKYAVTFPEAHVVLVDGSGHGYDRPIDMEKLYGLTLKFLTE